MTTSLAPYGHYAPHAWQAQLIALTRRLPETWLGRRLALWLRKPVIKSLGERPIDIEVLGAKMRLFTHDNVSEKRVLFTPQFFDATEIAVLRQMVHPHFQFADVGANAGIYSLAVAAMAGGQAKIVAVEPQPQMLERLRTNIALNGFSNIHVADCAVGDGMGEITLHFGDGNRGQASIAVAGERGVKVALKPLLTVFDEAGLTQPDAMKIDIEGAEDIALSAFFRDAPKNRYPKIIFMERNQGRWRQDAVQLCLNHGYTELHPGRMNAILALST